MHFNAFCRYQMTKMTLIRTSTHHLCLDGAIRLEWEKWIQRRPRKSHLKSDSKRLLFIFCLLIIHLYIYITCCLVMDIFNLQAQREIWRLPETRWKCKRNVTSWLESRMGKSSLWTWEAHRRRTGNAEERACILLNLFVLCTFCIIFEIIFD